MNLSKSRELSLHSCFYPLMSSFFFKKKKKGKNTLFKKKKKSNVTCYSYIDTLKKATHSICHLDAPSWIFPSSFTAGGEKWDVGDVQGESWDPESCWAPRRGAGTRNQLLDFLLGIDFCRVFSGAPGWEMLLGVTAKGVWGAQGLGKGLPFLPGVPPAPRKATSAGEGPRPSKAETPRGVTPHSQLWGLVTLALLSLSLSVLLNTLKNKFWN